MECGADILETGFMILVLCSSRNILFPYAPLRQGSRISCWVGGSMVHVYINQLILLIRNTAAEDGRSLRGRENPVAILQKLFFYSSLFVLQIGM